MQKNYIVNEQITVRAAIEKMMKERIKAVIVVDEANIVSGLFSNGDMRNFFLGGGSLSANICEAMNRNPRLFYSEDEVYEERQTCFRVIYPIIDSAKRVIKVLDFENINQNGKVNDSLVGVPLVIMAGGKGTRLYPYTKILPKPLIPIGDVTITERIIQSFQRYGCREVIMILKHKANMIKAYMAELEKDYKIEFAEEEEFLGTAGGLKLIRDKINTSFFLSNCDILTDADLECIYKTHIMKKNKITFVCAMKDMTIPYGVVETREDGTITQIKEKPGFSFLVNTGLYVLEPDVIDEVENGEVIDLPDLAKRYLERGEKVGVFPISEKEWMDMGQFNEMEKMIKNIGL